MQSVFRTTLIIGVLGASSAAHADFSANLGFSSEYYYRGIFQESSWAADVGDGLEVDGYFGYGANAGDFSYSIGFTGYYYTGDFDDTYQEINLGAGYGMVSVDVAIGEYDNFDGPTLDYTYYALTLEKNGFFGTFGGFTQDFEGEYLELGYGTTVAEIDLGLSLIFSNEDLVGEDDEAVVFTVGKAFDLK